MSPEQPAHRRLSWSATAPVGRVLLVLAAVFAFGTAGLAMQAARATPRHVVRQVTASPAPAVDASGCPVRTACTPGSTAPPAMLAALRRAFPDYRALLVTGVYDRATGAAYRVSLVATIGTGASVQLDAQRLPGGAPNGPPTYYRNDHGHTDLAGNTVVTDRTMFQAVPGRPGYSVYLVLHSSGSGEQYDDAAIQLAHDPSAQLAS